MKKNKIKVAIITGQLSYGGAESQVVLLSMGLLESSKYHPVVFCLSNHIDPYGRMLTESGVEWHQVPEGMRAGFGKLLWLIRNLRSKQCQLIYGFLHIGNIYGGAAAMALNAGFVASIRNADPGLPLLTKNLSAFMCRRADIVIANSDSSSKSLETDMGIFHQRVTVVQNAVQYFKPETGARERIRSELEIPMDALVVGTVANLKPQKRVDIFFDIFPRFQDMKKELEGVSNSVHFVWIGEGKDRVFVDRKCSSLAPELAALIHFPGARTDIQNCLSAFDLFVLTSDYEGMPNALLEAMASGLACIATDVPGTRDVIKTGVDATGVLVPGDEPYLFAKHIWRLLNDHAERGRIGDNARIYVQQNFSVDKLISGTERAFDGALRG